MSQYKVPQNVEAEDKILGPLTFKQFIYACIGVGWGLVCFAIFRALPAVMIILGFPPVLLFLLLAFYQRDGQNFEQLLIAMVGFFASERKRVWVKEAVTETFHVEPTPAPKDEISQLNPEEAHSRLTRLATLIDSRGWNRPADVQPDTYQFMPPGAHDDRIVVPPQAPRSPDEPHADMLDLQRSPLAQNLAQLLAEAAEDVKAEAVNQMSVPPGRRHAASGVDSSVSGVTAAGPNDILKLATLNDDLTVSQIQARATRLSPPAALGQEVDPRPHAR
jgi:PrgI family protein